MFYRWKFASTNETHCDPSRAERHALRLVNAKWTLPTVEEPATFCRINKRRRRSSTQDHSSLCSSYYYIPVIYSTLLFKCTPWQPKQNKRPSTHRSPRHQPETLADNKSISEDIINLQSNGTAPQQPGQHTSLFECQCEVIATLIAPLITVFHL